MKVSTRGRYTIRALVDLALSQGEEPVQIKEISKREGISDHYIEILFVKLRKAGFIKSLRGPKGGYQLSLPPSKIRVGDVLRVVEGPLTLVFCVDPQETKRICEKSEACVTRLLWKKISDRINSILDNTTLEDLCREAKKLKRVS